MHAVEVEANSFLDFAFYFLNRRARCDASGQVRYISRIVAVGPFDHDCVAHLLPSLKLSLLQNTVQRAGRTDPIVNWRPYPCAQGLRAGSPRGRVKVPAACGT